MKRFKCIFKTTKENVSKPSRLKELRENKDLQVGSQGLGKMIQGKVN